MPVGLEFLHRVRACLHGLGLVDRPLHCRADVRHVAPDAVSRLGDPGLRLGSGVLGLDHLL
ncbi:MAG: hypothetical protein ACLP8S_15955, partial [Solirubrobacteraceae bacterium]